MCSQVGTKHQDQVGQEGMLQLVLCRVGMLSVFLDMVRLASLLLRFVVTVNIIVNIMSQCVQIFYLTDIQFDNAFNFGQDKSLNSAPRREKPLKSIGMLLSTQCVFDAYIHSYFDSCLSSQVYTNRRQLAWSLVRNLQILKQIRS